MSCELSEDNIPPLQRLPPIQKPKFLVPQLVPGEELVTDPLRVYLLSDGREEYCGAGPGKLGPRQLDSQSNISQFCGNLSPSQYLSGGAVFLPAEGAIFLTNYRLIFKGSPIDPFSSEHTITRAFPVTSITREKKFSLNEYLSEIDQTLKEGLQVRSNTLQLIRAAFDDEVTVDEINNFRTNIHKTQYPATLWHLFAFRGHITLPPESSAKEKDKNGKYSTIKGFAKTTMKTVSKATGIKTKHKKSHKYMLPNMQPMHGRLSVPEMGSERLREEDELSDIVECPAPLAPVRSSHNTLDTRGLERLSDRRDCRDWVRLGLGELDLITAKMSSQPTEMTRISVVNHKYSVVRTLPALMVVPGKISDDSLKRLAKVRLR